MPRRHFATFTCFRTELTPGGASWNATSAWQPWQSVRQLLDHSLLLPCLYNTEYWAIIFFGEAAEGFISGELSNAAALRHQSTAKVKEAGEGCLCGESLLILLAEKRWRLCREMRGLTAVAQPRPDTWRGARRGHLEQPWCDQSIISYLTPQRLRAADTLHLPLHLALVRYIVGQIPEAQGARG